MDKVLGFIVSYLSDRGVDVSMDNCIGLNYMEDGIIDSFETLTFMMNIEEEFGIKITPVEMVNENNKTIDGLAKLIINKINS